MKFIISEMREGIKTYWFEVNGATFGIQKLDCDEYLLLDSEGYPIYIDRRYSVDLVEIERKLIEAIELM